MQLCMYVRMHMSVWTQIDLFLFERINDWVLVLTCCGGGGRVRSKLGTKYLLPPNNTRFGLIRYIVGMMLHIPMITRRIKDPKNTTRRQDEFLFQMSVFLLYVRRCLQNVCIWFKRVMHLPIIFHSTWLAIFA